MLIRNYYAKLKSIGVCKAKRITTLHQQIKTLNTFQFRHMCTAMALFALTACGGEDIVVEDVPEPTPIVEEPVVEVLPDPDPITEEPVVEVVPDPDPDPIVEEVVDSEGPSVASAGATSNTEIIVSFSEAMLGGPNDAENPSHYRITAMPDQGAFPAAQVKVISAELLANDATTVRLTTYSQADLSYLLVVTNMRDLAGNSIKAPEGSDAVIDPSRTQFVGVPPSGSELVDTDGDNLSDHEEQLGWQVTTSTALGNETVYFVSSDPSNPDTDGDGVTDNEEKHGALDPRSPDTDGDTLTDDEEWNTVFSDGTKQDTDGDGVQDGFEYFTFKTSPILADTDGDQMSDPDEVASGNRNPLIADLPSPVIEIGNIDLQLDTRFTLTTESGETREESNSVSSSLVRGTNDTFASSNENSTESTLAFSQSLSTTLQTGGSFNGNGSAQFPKASFTASASSGQGSSRGYTFSSSNESARATEEAFEESLSSSFLVDERESLTREVLDAQMKVDVSIDNAGNVPFSISNLEITAQVQDPRDRSRVIPIGSLTPENENLSNINIGALGDPSRGPFSFNTISVFPDQIEELMKNPRGIFLQLANFDITDELGNNFAFTSQQVLDRTASISFDLGNGELESYRIATASDHNASTGVPNGITVSYALQTILGLSAENTIKDGGNGEIETQAQGDDIQILAFGSQNVPNKVVIRPGANGTIDTTPAGDDVLALPDYVTQTHTMTDTIVDGGNGIIETKALSDDIAVAPVSSSVEPGAIVLTVGPNVNIDSVPGGDDRIEPAPKPFKVLSRYKDVETMTEQARFWAVFTNFELGDTDFDKIILKAGDQLDFTYVQDRDLDGVWAREEYLHGSSDLISDTDADGLSDKTEIQEGWVVAIKGTGEFRQVYPNPVQSDSDRDDLLDTLERECLIDPRQRDTDLDGLSDWEELTGRQVIDGLESEIIITDPESGAFVGVLEPYSACKDGSDPSLGGCEDGLSPHETIPSCDAALLAINELAGFATDPLNADTDGDEISDALEIRLGINPNDPSDGPLFLDDDGDGVPNLIEELGFAITLNTNTDSPTTTIVRSSANNTDSDDDGLPDLLEYRIRSNPSERDTDGDGISDFDEFANGNTCITNDGESDLCTDLGDIIDDNFNDILQDCDAADVCFIDPSDFDGNPGTSLTESDTDADGLSDFEEFIDLVNISVNGSLQAVTGGNNTLYGYTYNYSDPRVRDTDLDGLDDSLERSSALQTDPNNQDTDDDGKTDSQESAPGVARVPTIADRTITLRYEDFNMKEDCDPGLDGAGEFTWGLRWSIDGDQRKYPEASPWEQTTSKLSIDEDQSPFFFDTVSQSGLQGDLNDPRTVVQFTLAYGRDWASSGFIAEDENEQERLDWNGPRREVDGSTPNSGSESINVLSGNSSAATKACLATWGINLTVTYD